MMRLPPFVYRCPSTLAEAVDLLGEYGNEALLVAGGTDLYPSLKRRLFTPKALIGLTQLDELRQCRIGEGATLGAGLTLTAIATHPAIQAHYPALAQAAALVSTPQLRNMGTLGGNLCLDTRCTYYNQSEPWRQALGGCMKKAGCVCWVAPGSDHCLAVHSSDTAPILLALDAQVRLLGPGGERWLPVEQLYQADGMHYLTKRPDEILTEIVLPPAIHLRATYRKLRRRGSFDFPVLSIAVALALDDDGCCTQARIVVGAVAAAPRRVHAAEALLLGARLTGAEGAERVEAAATGVYQHVKPLDNTDMTVAYRKQMARVYAQQALQEIVRSFN